MRILLITHILPPAIDGGSRVISKLGQHLSLLNNEIYCLTTNCKSTDDFVNPSSSPLKINGVSEKNIYRLPVYKTFRKPLKLINLLIPKKLFLHQFFEVFQKGPVFKIIPFIRTILFLKKQNIDLIIAGPLPTTIVIYANFLKKIFKSKLLINASFHQTDKDFHKKPLINSLSNSDYIWSLTDFEKKYFTQKLTINPQKVILAGNGIDSNLIIDKEKIKFPSNPNLLFIGSLASHKRVELLIKAFISLKNQFPNLTLTIAGQKTLYFPKIQNLISNSNDSGIKFVFDFPENKLSNLIDSSTILILPSIHESFGLVLIESWARGKPVVTSDIPPLKELVFNTQGGLTFKSDSQHSLELTISKLLKNKSLCQKLGKNGLKYVINHYTWGKVTQKLWQKISL